MTLYVKKNVSTAFIKNKYIDPWFWSQYNLNPYNGCEFACNYCDSRSEKYYLHSNFEGQIFIKENLAGLLNSKLKNARAMRRDVFCIGGTTDPYQPAEEVYKISQQCLEVLYSNGFPVHICTKSDLILRDIELLEKIAKKTWCSVSVTITTDNEDIAKNIEPNAPPPDNRFKIFETIKKIAPKVQTGMLMMPLIPSLNDSELDIYRMVNKAATAGADYILFGAALTMRDRQALWFLNEMKNKYPEIISTLESLYNFEYNPQTYTGNYTANANYTSLKNKFFYQAAQKEAIKTRIPRFLPADFRGLNFALAEQIFLYSIENKCSKSLTNFAFSLHNLNETVRLVSVKFLMTNFNLSEADIRLIYNLLAKAKIELKKRPANDSWIAQKLKF